PLDEQPLSRGNNLNEELKKRYGNQPISPLNNLLTTIGNDVDNPPEKTREMVYEADPDAEWATVQIQITVME
ncbi:MAG: hypothetical protein AAFY21_16880, partial [Cyanobacteria bacterium J06641_2]